MQLCMTAAVKVACGTAMTKGSGCLLQYQILLCEFALSFQDVEDLDRCRNLQLQQQWRTHTLPMQVPAVMWINAEQMSLHCVPQCLGEQHKGRSDMLQLAWLCKWAALCYMLTTNIRSHMPQRLYNRPITPSDAVFWSISSVFQTWHSSGCRPYTGNACVASETLAVCTGQCKTRQASSS